MTSRQPTDSPKGAALEDGGMENIRHVRDRGEQFQPFQAQATTTHHTAVGRAGSILSTRNCTSEPAWCPGGGVDRGRLIISGP